MDENKFTMMEQNDDDLLEEQYAPIVLDDNVVQRNMQMQANFQPGGKVRTRTDIMIYGVIGMAVFLVIDMFLPYISMYILEQKHTMALFPGRIALGFIALAVITVGAMFLRKEPVMLSCAGLSVLLCIRAVGRADIAGFALRASGTRGGQKLLDVKYEFGFYGMIIGAVGLAIFALGYVMSTDVKVFKK